MLDIYPNLQEWMLVELFENLGLENIFRIAEKFSENPYQYRKGWPDLTIWKDGEVRFLEVKGPRDKMHSSQITILTNFIKPFGFNFSLVDVQAT